MVHRGGKDRQKTRCFAGPWRSAPAKKRESLNHFHPRPSSHYHPSLRHIRGLHSPIMTTAEYAIPDIHADPIALDIIAARIPSDARVYFLGDIVNKGPSTLEALKKLRVLHAGGNWQLAWGNHDLLFVRAMRGSRLALRDLFSRRGRSQIFAEIGAPRLQRDVDTIFGITDFVESEASDALLNEMIATLTSHDDLQHLVDWMIGAFRLAYRSPRQVLYIHAGVPVTDAGLPSLATETLTRYDQQLSADLRSDALDSELCLLLDQNGTSPLRLREWTARINDPAQFCAHLDVAAIVVGHSPVIPSTIADEPFPLIRHDFGASRSKNDLPSFLELTPSGDAVSHLRLDGKWKQIKRGHLSSKPT